MVSVNQLSRVLFVFGLNLAIALSLQTANGIHYYVNSVYRYSVHVPRPYQINPDESGVHGFQVHLDKAAVADTVAFAQYELRPDLSDVLGAGTKFYLHTVCSEERRVSIESRSRSQMKGLPAETVRGVCADANGKPKFAFDIVTIIRKIDDSVVIYGFTLETGLNRAERDRKVFSALLKGLRFLPPEP